jgi:type I site-specific restriction endonuclease
MQLNFPSYDFKIERQGESLKIFDAFRKKWVVLTPEEWVRQHVLSYLVQTKKYAAGLLAVERSLTYNTRKKRFDILVFDKQAKPFMLVECKAPEVKLSEETLIQICTYNTVFKVPFLFISNGFLHLLYALNDEANYVVVQDFPELA